MNARIADLIREGRADEITDAVAEGDFFQMQTFSQALIEHVLSGARRPRGRRERRDEPPRLPRLARAGDEAQARTPTRRRRRAAGRAQHVLEPEAVPAPTIASRRAGRGPRPAHRPGGLGACAASRRSRSCSRSPCSPAPRARTPSPSCPTAPFALPGLDAEPVARRAGDSLSTPPAVPVQLSYPQLLGALAARRRGVRHPVAGARRDQQGRVELGPQHGPELGRRDRLDAVHARHVAALGRRRERRRHRRSLEPDRCDLLRRALPRRGRRRDRSLSRRLRVQPRRLVRATRCCSLADLYGGEQRRSRSRSTGMQQNLDAARAAAAHAGERADRGAEASRGASRVSSRTGRRAPRRRRCSPTGSRSSSSAGHAGERRDAANARDRAAAARRSRRCS